MIEPIDILTPDGTPTGSILDKSEAHRTGAWHRAAHLWIVTPDGKLLLQRRALAKENWPGKWDVSVAGHVGAGESAEEAAIREAKEELGLTIDAAELTHLGTLSEECVLNGGTYVDNEIHDIFLARREVDLDALTFNDEVMAAALVSPELLATYDLVPHPAEYVLLRTIV